MEGDASLAPRPASRAVFICLLAVIAFGVVGRLVGQTTIQLWVDESDWAMRAADGTDTFIRPAGSMWLARHTIALYNSEVVLRLPSLIAGIALLPLFYGVARRLVRPAVAVVALVALVCHPVAMGMSREFKPYAVEATLHMLVLLLALRQLHQPTPRHALQLAATTTLAPLFSWSIVFSYPGAYGFALLDRFKQWRSDRRFVVLVGGVVTTFVMLGALFMARISGEDRKAEYWGNRYNVFFVGEGVGKHLAWFWKKTIKLLWWPGKLDLPSSDARITQTIVLVLLAIGVVAFVRRRQLRVLVLLALPLVMTLVFNLLGQWPWGIFRTNFYLLPLLLVVAAIGLDLVVDGLERVHPLLTRIGAAVVVVAFLAVAPRWASHFDTKGAGSLTGQSDVRTALVLLHELEAQAPTTTPPTKAVLLLDNHACRSFLYYRDHHTAISTAHKAWYDEHIDARCVPGPWWPRFVKENASTPYWVMSAQRSLQDADTAQALYGRCTPRELHPLRNMILLHCEADPPAPEAPPAAADVDDGVDPDED